MCQSRSPRYKEFATTPRRSASPVPSRAPDAVAQLSARLCELLLQRQSVKLWRRYESVAAYQHASLRKQSSRRKPYRAASRVKKFKSTIDVVVLLPEAPALPCNFVSTRVGTLPDDLLIRRAEIIRYLLQHDQWHAADAIVRVNRFVLSTLRVANPHTPRRLSYLGYGRSELH